MRQRRAPNEKMPYTIAQNAAYLLRVIWQDDRLLLLLLGMEMLGGVLQPFLAIFLPRLVVTLVETRAPLEAIVRQLGPLILGLAAAQGVKGYGQGKYWIYNATRNDYMLKIYFKGLTLDYALSESPEGLAQYARAFVTVAGGDNSGTSIMISSLCELGLSGLGFVLYASVLSLLNPWIVLLLTATSYINHLAMGRGRRLEEGNRTHDALLGKKQFYLTGVAKDAVAGKDVRLYGMRAWFQAVFEGLLADKWASTWRVATWRLQTRLVGALTLLMRDGLAYAYLIVLAIHGRVGLADFTLYFGAITGFSTWVTGILIHCNRLLEGSRKVCDMRAYLEMPDTPAPADPLPPPPLNAPPSIAFEDVCFGYEPGKPVLEHVSFRIEAGQRLALVGVNGAGKTTLVKLLCGFYKPWSGRILLGGVDIGRISREQLYTAYSAVFQEFPIFPFTLAENVGMTAGAALDKRRVLECLDAAGLGEFARSLPQGVDAPMLKVISDEGVVLSGGQQQRLILARALYKAAPVLLLDEPTAALDPIAESALYEAYAAFTWDRTALYISHRLASTRFCDRVILLEGGRVLESGTHEALVKAGGAYARMFETQSRYYKDHPEGGAEHEAV